MKKGKTIYLIASIFLFIIVLIPYFQNTAINPPMQFFWSYTTLMSSYMWILTFGMALGACIILYVQSVISDINKTEPEKFNLE